MRLLLKWKTEFSTQLHALETNVQFANKSSKSNLICMASHDMTFHAFACTNTDGMEFSVIHGILRHQQYEIQHFFGNFLHSQWLSWCYDEVSNYSNQIPIPINMAARMLHGYLMRFICKHLNATQLNWRLITMRTREDLNAWNN